MERWIALFIFGTCGTVGVLVDLDHLVAFFLRRYVNPRITEGRLWHTPLLILSGLAICYLGSHIVGLYGRLVLIGVISATVLTLVLSSKVVWRM